MRKPSVLALAVICGSCFVISSVHAQTGSILVHGIQVDLTNQGFVMFSIDVESKGGSMKAASLEYWVDERPHQILRVDPAIIQGAYLIARITLAQDDLEFDRMVYFQWTLENETGAVLKDGLRSFFNADISPWMSLAWKSFETEHFLHQYKVNEATARSYAILAERAYDYLAKEFGRALPFRIPIRYYDGRLHAFIEKSGHYGAGGTATRNSITISDNSNDIDTMYATLVHELTHTFDFIAIDWAAIPKGYDGLPFVQFRELHARCMELDSLPKLQGIIETRIVCMSDAAIENLPKDPQWGYSYPLSYGFFNNLSRYAAGADESLHALIDRQGGLTILEKCELLAGKNLDALLAEAVVYLKDYRDAHLLDHPVQGLVLKVLEETAIHNEYWVPFSGTFSGDGTRIIATGDYYPGTTEKSFVMPVPESSMDIDDVMILDIANGTVADLTRDSYSQWAPVWSPDEADVYFIGRYGPGYGIYRTTAAGVIKERLFYADDRLGFMALAESGKGLIFSKEEGLGRSNLFLLDIASGTVTRLTDQEYLITSFVHASPGSFLLSVAGNPDGSIFLLDGSSGRIDALESEMPFVEILCVAPDGRSALVRTDAAYALYSPRTGKVDTVLLQDPTARIVAAAFNPAGDLVVFARTKTAGTIIRYQDPRL